eukprot:scaffold18506_cov20-Tisochrysis_lutea.AAC.1
MHFHSSWQTTHTLTSRHVREVTHLQRCHQLRRCVLHRHAQSAPRGKHGREAEVLRQQPLAIGSTRADLRLRRTGCFRHLLCDRLPRLL